MRPGAMAAVESMLGGIVPVLLLAAALVAGGLVHAQQSRSPPAGVPTAPTAAAPFKKPKIAEKAEEIYKKITATGFYPTIRGLAAGTGIGPGLTFWKARPFGGPIGILATIGWNPKVLLIEGRLGRVPSRPGDIPDRRFPLEALTTDPLGGSNHRWFAFLEARSVDIKNDSLFFTSGPDGEPQPVKFPSATRFLDESPESGTVPFDVIDRDLDSEEGKVVPFYFQRALGGSHTLRSYPLFRFRGTRRQAFSVEYRLGLLRLLELAAFYDGGKVWGGVEALGSQGYRDSAGASARWVSEKDVIARAFGAYGGEGWRFGVTGSFPF